MTNLKLLSSLLTLIFVCSTIGLLAQNDIPFGDLPPNPEYGKCYAKCKMPDQYEYVETQQLVKAAGSKTRTIPAQYETRTEQIVIKDASTRLVTIPARYETRTEQVVIKEAETSTRTIPAKYKTVKERVLVSPARGAWTKKKKSPNCFSANPDDCYVVCWEEKAAEYKTVTRTVEVSPESTTSKTKPAQYKTIKKRVLVEPARVEEKVVPAQYKTISKRVLISPARTETIPVPAQYKTVREKKLISVGSYTGWTEILCAAKTTSNKVSQVQRALKAAGYAPGPIDGVMGIKTQAALKQYQTDKGLPLGNLNMQTLQALGVQG